MMRVRSEAKANMRRFVDDVSFVASKESRDRLKGIQRQAATGPLPGDRQPDHPPVERVIAGTLASAKLEENERNSRVRELERQLNILRQVVEHAENLMPTAANAAAGA